MPATKNRSDTPIVSVDPHHPTSPPVDAATRRFVDRFPVRIVPLSAAALVVPAAIVVAVLATALSVRAVGAQGSQAGEGRLDSVQFDLVAAATDAADPLSAAGASHEARYRTVAITEGGAAVRLQPLPGMVEVTLSAEHAAAMTADVNGLQIGHGNDDFGSALADAISSSSAHRFARLAATADGRPLSINVFYARPLTALDHLLIQELGGNAAIDVAAIDREGEPLGGPVRMGPTFQWNTGHGPPSEGSSWASVVRVGTLAEPDRPIAGIRITALNAQVKAVALAPIGSATPPPQSVDTPDGGSAQAVPAAAAQTGAPAQAAIGLEAKIQPALAVDGAGCAANQGSEPSELVAGQAATFCFTVTNLGTADLTDVTITDERLGLVDAALPQAAGPQVLAPGQQAIYYYHSVVDQRPPDATSMVKARTTDGSGEPVVGLVDPTAASAAGEVAAPTEPVSSPEPPVAAEDPGESPSNQAASAGGSPLGETPAITQLALTGMVTEPWVVVIFAMAFIFIGYTLYAAYNRQNADGETCGHDQLDSLGFD